LPITGRVVAPTDREIARSRLRLWADQSPRARTSVVRARCATRLCSAARRAFCAARTWSVWPPPAVKLRN